jgi:hypothetical protein
MLKVKLINKENEKSFETEVHHNDSVGNLFFKISLQHDINKIMNEYGQDIPHEYNIVRNMCFYYSNSSR